MSSVAYREGLDAIAALDLDWESDGIRCLMVGDGYVPSENHSYLSDIPSRYRVSDSAVLQGRQVIDGAFYADDTLIPRVSDFNVLGVAIFRSTDALLICFIEKQARLPIDVNVSGLLLAWSGSPNYVWRL